MQYKSSHGFRLESLIRDRNRVCTKRQGIGCKEAGRIRLQGTDLQPSIGVRQSDRRSDDYSSTRICYCPADAAGNGTLRDGFDPGYSIASAIIRTTECFESLWNIWRLPPGIRLVLTKTTYDKIDMTL